MNLVCELGYVNLAAVISHRRNWLFLITDPHTHTHTNTHAYSNTHPSHYYHTQKKKQGVVVHLLTETNYRDVGKFKQAFKHSCGGKKKGTGGNHAATCKLNF